LVSTRPELDQSNFHTVKQIKELVSAQEKKFDLVFVDHGPTWRARLCDLGWCCSALASDGQMILDDWYPPETRANRNYTVPARRRLHRLGMKLKLADGSQRDGDRKSLCLARALP
jgi:predicted O-methyltransferase YrrM